MAVRASKRFRAVVALVALVAFYASAIAAIVALGLAGATLVMMAPDVDGNTLIAVILGGAACLLTSGVLAWSVRPRRERFTPPGPEVTALTQPALFAELRRVAAATGEAAPAHVYVSAEVAAFVIARDGRVGRGGGRVMGVGMPLARALSVSELRAVIAHELGHFDAADGKLRPWIYQRQRAMRRIVDDLGRATTEAASLRGVIGLAVAGIQAPLRVMAMGVVRVSQAVCRAQEYAADGVAVRVEGAAALIGGLTKATATARAHAAYLRDELAPMVDQGVLPPVGAGFASYLVADRLRARPVDADADERGEGAPDPADAHPALRDRIAAAEGRGGAAVTVDERPAIELFDDPEQYETGMVRARVGQPLRDVAWADVAAYWPAVWRDAVDFGRATLTGLTVSSLPRAQKDVTRLARRSMGDDANQLGDAELRGWLTSVAGAALALRLIDAGYAVVSAHAEPHRLVAGDDVVEPFAEVAAWLGGQGPDDALTTRFRPLGVADAPLVDAADDVG